MASILHGYLQQSLHDSLRAPCGFERFVRDRYQHLRQPSWKPPRIAFAIVWPILYTLMGTASWLVWHNGGWQQHSRALSLYAVQLVLNLSWPPLFFSGHKLGLALADSTGEACKDISKYDNIYLTLGLFRICSPSFFFVQKSRKLCSCSMTHVELACNNCKSIAFCHVLQLYWR